MVQREVLFSHANTDLSLSFCATNILGWGKTAGRIICPLSISLFDISLRATVSEE